MTVTTSAAGGDYVGQVTATPSTLGAATSANYALKVLQLPALTLSQCSGTAPGTGAGVFSCRLGNSGTGAGTGIAYQAGSGVTVAGPTSCAAAIADCGGVTVTTAASAGTYAGTVSATAGNGGSGASTGYSLTVNTPPALALTNCASSATSTAAGTMSCTLSNSGQTAA